MSVALTAVDPASLAAVTSSSRTHWIVVPARSTPVSPMGVTGIWVLSSSWY